MALNDLTNFSDELRQRYIEFYGNPSEHKIVCRVNFQNLKETTFILEKLNYCILLKDIEYIEDMINKITPFPKPVNAIKEEIRECKKGKTNGTNRIMSNLNLFLLFLLAFIY